LKEEAKGIQKLSLLKGDHQARAHSDQMVLVMVRQENGLHERWPKMLKRESEKNSRKPRDLVRKPLVTA
jgi:hypothetical protein